MHADTTVTSSLLLSSLELSDTTIYEPYIRALLGTASHFTCTPTQALPVVPRGVAPRVTPLWVGSISGKYRNRSMQHTCSRHEAWDPHTQLCAESSLPPSLPRLVHGLIRVRPSLRAVLAAFMKPFRGLCLTPCLPSCLETFHLGICRIQADGGQGFK